MTWILPPSTCFPCALESEASTLECDSLFPILELFVWWRETSSAAQSWSKRWRRVSWIRVLSGRIFEASTAGRGVALWISSLAATRASLSARQDVEQEQKIHDTCFHTSPASWSRCSLPWCFSRTSQATFLWDSIESQRIYSAWVSSLRQDYSRRKKSVRRIVESGSSSWRTPSASDGEGGVMQMLPDRDGKYKLRDHAVHAMKQWPTPAVADTEGSRKTRSGKRSNELLLNGIAAQWPTPISRDYKSGQDSERTLARNSRPMSEVALAFGLPSHQTSTHGDASPRRLNPLFVEWLMGMPLGWTDFEHLETESFLSWQHTHSELLQRLLDAT